MARVGWGGQTVENMALVGRKFELDQIQVNMIQLEPTQAKWVAQRYLTPSKLWTWFELEGPFGQGFSLDGLGWRNNGKKEEKKALEISM